MDVKDKDALYALKVKELKEVDRIYMKGFKAALDYIACKAIPEAEDDLFHIDNDDLRMGAKRSFHYTSDYFLEKLYDRLFYEIEATTDYYAEVYAADLIPDEDDIPDPAWMDCEKNCQDCREECEKRTEKFLDDGL